VHRFLQHHYRVTFDGFALNWYRDGRDGQAFHRDRDMQWLDETVIAILTLGATRPWLLRPRANRYAHDLPDKGAVIDLAPGSGDLHVMGGATQAGWEHSVAQIGRPVGGRISVQWRWTSRRGRQERGGSYRKPRHYSRE
jgi:alkylated DNA repair dioxygenase AlkB